MQTHHYILLIVFCAIGTFGCYQYLKDSYKVKHDPDADIDFLKAQRFINRCYTEECVKKATVMVNDYIATYGMTPNATRLQVQLQNKRIFAVTGVEIKQPQLN